MSKKKFPLQQCLTILNDALAHVEKYPTTLVGERGLASRTTKQVLERVVNQMNLKMELSDYQGAALLLGLPSIIRSDMYVFGDPKADLYYRCLQEKQNARRSRHLQGPTLLQRLMAQLSAIDGNNNVGVGVGVGVDGGGTSGIGVTDPNAEAADGGTEASSSLPPIEYDQKSLGRLRVFAFHEEGPSGEDIVSKTIVPCSALYANRGKALRFLNRNEYRALVGDKKKSSDTGRSKVTEYSFASNFEIGCQYTQYPIAKHRTVVLTSKAPRYPGPEVPPNDVDYKQWKRRADRYASYFLTEFRPEEDCYKDGQVNRYRYDWDALKGWVHDYEMDPYIITKFRLMAMNTRMRGFATRFHDKVMLTEYRGKCRYLWPEEELQRHAAEDFLERMRERQERNIIDEELYSQTYNRLSVRSRMSVDRQVAYDSAQLDAFNSLFPETPQQQSGQQQRQRSMTQRPAPVASGLYSGNDVESLEKIATELRTWKKADGASAVSTREIDADIRERNLQLLEKSMRSKEQKEFFRVYRDYFSNPYNKKCHPPDIVLLHGAAGTGKSTVIRAIVKAAHYCGYETLNTAFNNINALDLGGHTTASLIALNMKTDMETFTPMKHQKLLDLRKLMKGVRLIIVDEISTQAPFHLAQLSWAIQQAVSEERLEQIPECLVPRNLIAANSTMTDPTKYFGGIPVIFAGDLNQLGPVKAGDCLTVAVMKLLEHEFGPVRKPKRRRRRR